MKAIRVEEFGEPEVMKLVEVPPPQPGPGQALVRMHAIGVNPVPRVAGDEDRISALCSEPG